MHDPRIDALSRQLVRYSTKVKKGDLVWIDLFDVPNTVGQSLIREVVAAGGMPMVRINDAVITREQMIHASEKQYDIIAENNLALMKQTDCYIAVRGSHNITADIELIPIQQINAAYERLTRSDVKYRFVIDMASLKQH